MERQISCSNERHEQDPHDRFKRLAAGDKLCRPRGKAVVKLYESAAGFVGEQIAVPESPQQDHSRLQLRAEGRGGDKAFIQRAALRQDGEEKLFYSALSASGKAGCQQYLFIGFSRGRAGHCSVRSDIFRLAALPGDLHPVIPESGIIGDKEKVAVNSVFPGIKALNMTEKQVIPGMFHCLEIRRLLGLDGQDKGFLLNTAFFDQKRCQGNSFITLTEGGTDNPAWCRGSRTADNLFLIAEPIQSYAVPGQGSIAGDQVQVSLDLIRGSVGSFNNREGKGFF